MTVIRNLKKTPGLNNGCPTQLSVRLYDSLVSGDNLTEDRSVTETLCILSLKTKPLYCLKKRKNDREVPRFLSFDIYNWNSYSRTIPWI